MIRARPGNQPGFLLAKTENSAAKMLRQNGTVRWFSADKRYGFIARDGQDDVFFHLSGVRGEAALEKGQAVSFLVKPSAKGPKAVDVQVDG